MSNPTRAFVLTTAWRELPATDRWQKFQAQLSHSAATDSQSWTRRSVVICSWRVLRVDASAPKA